MYQMSLKINLVFIQTSITAFVFKQTALPLSSASQSPLELRVNQTRNFTSKDLTNEAVFLHLNNLNKVAEVILKIYLDPLLSALTNKNPKQQQLQFPTTLPWVGPALFFLGVECAPDPHVENEKRLLTSTQKCKKSAKTVFSPLGHICTFVANENPFAACFTVLWNEALTVIYYLLISIRNYYSSCGIRKRLPTCSLLTA